MLSLFIVHLHELLINVISVPVEDVCQRYKLPTGEDNVPNLTLILPCS